MKFPVIYYKRWLLENGLDAKSVRSDIQYVQNYLYGRNSSDSKGTFLGVISLFEEICEAALNYESVNPNWNEKYSVGNYVYMEEDIEKSTVDLDVSHLIVDYLTSWYMEGKIKITKTNVMYDELKKLIKHEIVIFTDSLENDSIKKRVGCLECMKEFSQRLEEMIIKEIDLEFIEKINSVLCRLTENAEKIWIYNYFIDFSCEKECDVGLIGVLENLRGIGTVNQFNIDKNFQYDIDFARVYYTLEDIISNTDVIIGLMDYKNEGWNDYFDRLRWIYQIEFTPEMEEKIDEARKCLDIVKENCRTMIDYYENTEEGKEEAARLMLLGQESPVKDLNCFLQRLYEINCYEYGEEYVNEFIQTWNSLCPEGEEMEVNLESGALIRSKLKEKEVKDEEEVSR